MPPFAVLAAGALFFGAILGSFLNAILFRFNTGRSALEGRSRCMHCGHPLAAADLVPLVSYLFLRGRCRYCSTKISWQYPLVEAAAAALSLWLFLAYPDPVRYLFLLLVWLVVLFIVIYDLRHMIIPWSASLTLLGLALAWLALLNQPSPGALLSGPLLASPLFLLSLVSRGRWMGWADSLFELSLGTLLGLTAGLTALLLAIWIGAAVGIGLILFTKRATIHLRSEIPFAPFLALGALIALLFHVDFFSTLPLIF